MSALLEFVRIAGLISLVWFALVGWKLIPATRGHNPRRTASGIGD